MKSKQLPIFAGIAVIGLLGTIALWVSVREGERTRQAISEAADKQRNIAVEQLADRAERVFNKTIGAPGEIVGGEPAEQRPGKPEGQAGVGIFDRMITAAQEIVDGGRSEGAQRDGSAAEPGLQPETLIEEMFRLGREVARTADAVGQELVPLTTEEEKEVGRELRKPIETVLVPMDAPKEVARLERLAAPVLQRRARQDIAYRFTVVDQPEVNAFALPGGFVYVSKGLLEWAESDRDVQFVLAHEIAHVDLRHCARQVTYLVRASQLGGETGGLVVQMAYGIFARGYAKDQEFEADAWAYQRLRELGSSREEILAAARRLAHRLEQDDPPVSKPNDLWEKLLYELNHHLRSHPPVGERLRRLEALGS